MRAGVLTYFKILIGLWLVGMAGMPWRKLNRSKRKHALPALSFLLSFPSFLFNLSLFCPSVSLSFLCFSLLSVSPTPHCMPERLKQAISIVLIRKSNPVLISLSSNNPLGYTDILLLCLFRILQVSNLVAYSEELINRNGMQKLRYLLSGDSVKWIIERKNTLETLLVAHAFFFFFSFFFFFVLFCFSERNEHTKPLFPYSTYQQGFLEDFRRTERLFKNIY